MGGKMQTGAVLGSLNKEGALVSGNFSLCLRESCTEGHLGLTQKLLFAPLCWVRCDTSAEELSHLAPFMWKLFQLISSPLRLFMGTALRAEKDRELQRFSVKQLSEQICPAHVQSLSNRGRRLAN